MAPTRLAVTVFALLLPACLTVDEQTCADGLRCPAAARCVPDEGCVPEAQFTACADLADGSACRVTGIDGLCRDGRCVAARCGDGVVDPTEVCDDGNGNGGDGCTPDCLSNETCGNGIVDYFNHEACDGAPTAEGPCRANCTIIRCGDGVTDLDRGEVCDDGNLHPGDGCTPDCLSDESCGNGVLDYLAGERCDDGGRDELDGCASTCEPEATSWRASAAAAAPTAVRDAGVAYDPVRGRLVLFGGVGPDGQTLDETWELVADTWHQVLTPVSPPPRNKLTMSYDVARHRIAIHGGAGGFSDVWTYDGATWTKDPLAPVPAPGARNHAMAYDSARQRQVVFGGQGRDDRTYEYDGAAWTAVETRHRPAARYDAQLAYDPRRGRVLMFGGARTTTNAILGDTWSYDGRDWQELVTATTPPPRQNAAMVYDQRDGSIVLWGGYADAGGGATSSNDMWRFDGVDWHMVEQLAAPTPRYDHALAYDGTAQRLILTGGGPGTWTFDGAGWHEVTPPPAPSPRYAAAIAYDAARGRLVLFGGYPHNDETWEFDGARWWPMTPLAEPGARGGAGMTYDQRARRVIMFGGAAGNSDFPTGYPGGIVTVLDDTWAYDGTTWTELAVPVRPPARLGSPLAYDPESETVAMFGGWDGDGSTEHVRGDTWRFDGATWTEVAAAAPPSARYGHGLVYDGAGQRIVLFGGWYHDDTWTLVGDTWTQLVPEAGWPSVRGDPSMTYDPRRQMVVLVGGNQVRGRGWDALNDVWLLHGSAWTREADDDAPPSRAHQAAAFHDLLGRVVQFGGIRAGVPAGDTWSFGFEPRIGNEACSAALDVDDDGVAGCDDSACWPWCTPTCSDGASTEVCAASSFCGDSTCDALETCRLCPVDCGACPAACGDGFCDAPETAATCPGDCLP